MYIFVLTGMITKCVCMYVHICIDWYDYKMCMYVCIFICIDWYDYKMCMYVCIYLY